MRPGPPARQATNGSSPEIRTSIASGGGLGLGLGGDGDPDGEGEGALGEGGADDGGADSEPAGALGLGLAFGRLVTAAVRMIARTFGSFTCRWTANFWA